MIKATIIGAGQVGITLALKLADAKNMSFELIYKSEESKERAIESGVSSANLNTFESSNFSSEFIILAVGDGDVEVVTLYLCDKLGKSLKDKVVFHTSGTASKMVLSPLADYGAIVASAHPYQTFYLQKAEVLNNVPWGIEADDFAFSNIVPLIEKLDGRAIRLSQETIEQKSLYHISAVAASNFMALSIALAKQIANNAGIDPVEFLPQILQTTLSNNIDRLEERESAITGPVVRGDIKTISNHIESLGDNVNGVLYKNLSESLALLAFDNGVLSGDKFEQIMEILDK